MPRQPDAADALPTKATAEYTAWLEHRVRALEERVRIAASHFYSMAEGFEKIREPSKAAACQGMGAMMEDGL